jgi:glyoxylase-like metal-dependent hydrolase (beta-lactamase superfamily II)
MCFAGMSISQEMSMAGSTAGWGSGPPSRARSKHKGGLVLVNLMIALCGLATHAQAGEAVGKQSLAPYVVQGDGFVIDSSHPMHPGDARRYPLHLRISSSNHPEGAWFSIAVSDSGDTTSRPDIWYVRSGRVTRADSAGVETPDAGLGDVRPEAVAVLFPDMATEPQDVRGWQATEWATEMPNHAPTVLHRTFFDERLGDQEEEVHYDTWFEDLTAKRGGPDLLWTAEFERGGRTVARFTFPLSSETGRLNSVPPPGPQRIDVEDRNTIHQLAPGQVDFKELVPHIFCADLDSLNTRVTVAEFTDSLVVIEGAYGSAACDVIARVVRERFHKPVRMFAFSHLHGQYSGGTRSWVHEGATIVVPPTTGPLIHQMVDASFASHPDALARDPKPLHVLTVPQHLHVEDSMNALDIYNVPSGHTDEYFLFHFPRQRVLLTGDLMFLRPGKPFAGRSRQLGDTVAKLGLAVDTYVATWPLHGYGTKNIVTGDEFRTALAAAAGAKP